MRKRAAIATLLLVPILALVVCGGDDDESDGSGATGPTEVIGEESPTELPAMVLIMDASGSMQKKLADGTRRIDAAKDALRSLLSELPAETEVGLRVYGNKPPPGEGCGPSATELISPVTPLDPAGLDSAIDGFVAKGRTPIGLSLEAAASDLPAEGERAIILVSDGKDTCAPPDPCQVASGLEGAGIEVRIDTVGFALGKDQEAKRELECIAEAGGGAFHDVSDAKGLGEALARAAAFNPEPQPVECARRFEEAPELPGFGVYTQTIKGGAATAYCAVELAGARKIQVQLTVSPGPGNKRCSGGMFNVYGKSTSDLIVGPIFEDGDCNDTGSTVVRADGFPTEGAERAVIAIETRCIDARCFDHPYPIELTVRAVG